MKLQREDKLVKLFEFKDSAQLKSMESKELRSGVQHSEKEEIRVPIRDRVTEVEFDEDGFKELKIAPSLEEIPLVSSIEEFVEYFNSFPNGLHIKEYTEDTLTVTPIYIANVRETEVFNIFDTTGRMKYYNFLTQVNSSQKNNWVIVTPINKERIITGSEFLKIVPWTKRILSEANPAENSSTEMQRETSERIEKGSYYIPVIEVENKLAEEKISLLAINTTLEEIAISVGKGEIKVEDITQKLLIDKFGSIEI